MASPEDFVTELRAAQGTGQLILSERALTSLPVLPRSIEGESWGDEDLNFRVQFFKRQTKPWAKDVNMKFCLRSGICRLNGV